MSVNETDIHKLSGRVVLACHSLSGDLWFDDYTDQLVIVSPNELLFRELLRKSIAPSQVYVRGVISNELGREKLNTFSAGWLNSMEALLPECRERMPRLEDRGSVFVDTIGLNDLLAALFEEPSDAVTLVIDMFGDARGGLKAAAAALAAGYIISDILLHLATPTCHEGGLCEEDVRDWAVSSGREFEVQTSSAVGGAIWMRLSARKTAALEQSVAKRAETGPFSGFQIRHLTVDDIAEILKRSADQVSQGERRPVPIEADSDSASDISAFDAALNASKAREMKALSDLASMKKQYYSMVTHTVELERLLGKAIGFVPENDPEQRRNRKGAVGSVKSDLRKAKSRSPRKKRAQSK